MRNEKMKTAGARILVALVAMFLLGSGAVLAQAQRTEGAKAQGVQVAIDPVTGALRQPTPAETKALADAFRSMAGRTAASTVAVEQWADGTLIATAGPEFLNFWLASVDADGSLAQVCVEGQENAANFALTSGVWEEK
jgi:hypothetical protein